MVITVNGLVTVFYSLELTFWMHFVEIMSFVGFAELYG